MDSGVEYLPPSVMGLNNLEQLEIINCPLIELPFEKVGGERETLTDSGGTRVSTNMLGLKYFNLSLTYIAEISFPRGVCPNLQYLKIECCHALEKVGALPTNTYKTRVNEMW